MAKENDLKPKARKSKGPNPLKRMRQFFKEVFGEVKKLSWPSKKDVVSYTATVVAFILLMSAIIFVLDLAFGSGIDLLTAIRG
jgi:preprotein translocase subunit SecE